jgi:hypothetical protein
MEPYRTDFHARPGHKFTKNRRAKGIVSPCKIKYSRGNSLSPPPHRENELGDKKKSQNENKGPSSFNRREWKEKRLPRFLPSKAKQQNNPIHFYVQAPYWALKNTQYIGHYYFMDMVPSPHR